MNPFDAIYKAIFLPIFTLIAQTIVLFHRGFGAIFGETSGLAWVLSIIMLTVTVRILLFPVFVKQIKTQRSMQVLQPKIKALQAKHKGDRETLNAELMKLYKEHGANPLAGCLPPLLQMPIFLGMYQVLTKLRPQLRGEDLVFPDGKFGVSQDIAEQLGRAKIFGAPVASAFTSPQSLLRALDASPLAVKIVALVLIIAMTAVTFISTKQMMAKNSSTPLDPQQVTQQKILLYVLPAMLAVFGFGAPLGVLLYWTTSNLWSLGQQVVVLRRMPPPGDAPNPTPAAKAAASTRGASTATPPVPSQPTTPSRNGATATASARPAKPRKKKGGRRGGRR
ncbi:MAG TPA: membrane protein insertase YidC [Mycobacteriales bacterium]|nr:membrane protein insertase YidC [Mycobacteriales bacterium]